MIVGSIISLILLIYYALVVVVFYIGWKKLAYFNPKNNTAQVKFSIIISARNEEQNIQRTIECILNQKYPKDGFELIIIDDNSEDKTAEIVTSYSKQGVMLIPLVNETGLNSYKKRALEMGIQRAKGDFIITTDADCWMGQNWLSSIASFITEKQVRFISSPVCYGEERNLLEKLQTIDFLALIGGGAASIGYQKPSTCNGANLTYSKDLFFEVKGFKGIDKLASGDDELLLQKIAQQYPNTIGFLKNKDAIVYTSAKPTLKEFIEQRKRWASKSTHYRNKTMSFLIFSIWIFNLSIIINCLLSPFFNTCLILFATQLLIKMLVEFICLSDILRFMQRRDLSKFIPLFSFVHAWYVVFIILAGKSGKYEWKNRMVH